MKSCRRLVRAATGLVLATAVLSSSAGGQNPRESESLPGTPITPEMARLVAGAYVRDVAKKRYDLPEDKLDQAQETVARRLMEFAHSVDGPGQELVQRYLEEQFKYLAQDAPGRLIPPKFGKEFADRATPFVPNIRELIKGVGQDLRPMLPLKHQLKLAGDLMAANTAVSSFEQLMQLWSSGQDNTYSNPFRDQPTIRKDDSGVSAPLKSARQEARERVKRSSSEWLADYLAQFKKLYELDAAQAATADSVWREFADRETTILQAWAMNDRVYQYHLWMGMSDHLPDSRRDLFKELIMEDVGEVDKDRAQLGTDFRRRLESIPTEPQRRRVQVKVTGMLKEKGLLTAETQP